MTQASDDILDNLFHGCALRAYVEVWQEAGRFPPDPEITRRRAYSYYEQALAEKARRRPTGQRSDDSIEAEALEIAEE